MRDGAVAGFRYFEITEPTSITVWLNGTGKGEMQVSDTADFRKSVHISVEVDSQNMKCFQAELPEIYGKSALYFKYVGEGSVNFYQFELR